MKKSIAIVGATEENGRSIAMKFASLPYRLLLVSTDFDEANHLRNDISPGMPETELEFLDCAKEGCWEADIIILAVPYERIGQVAERIKEVATQKIVVEVCNDNDISKKLIKILPYSKLVKVTGDLHSKIKISGDDKAVNEEISEIFNLAGFQMAI